MGTKKRIITIRKSLNPPTKHAALEEVVLKFTVEVLPRPLPDERREVQVLRPGYRAPISGLSGLAASTSGGELREQSGSGGFVSLFCLLSRPGCRAPISGDATDTHKRWRRTAQRGSYRRLRESSVEMSVAASLLSVVNFRWRLASVVSISALHMRSEKKAIVPLYVRPGWSLIELEYLS